jgi:hypothetical protein
MINKMIWLGEGEVLLTKDRAEFINSPSPVVVGHLLNVLLIGKKEIFRSSSLNAVQKFV